MGTTIRLPAGHELREPRPGRYVVVDTAWKVASPPGLYEVLTEVGPEVVRLEAIGGRPVKVRMWRDDPDDAREVLASDVTVVGRVVAEFTPLHGGWLKIGDASR